MTRYSALPPYITQYFWGDNLKELDLEKHQRYIVQTLLEKGDKPSIKWLFHTLGEERVRTLLPKLTLSDISKNFWRIYLS